MTLRSGKHGPIVNSENVCKGERQITLRFAAHNNLGQKGKLGLAVPCGKGSAGKGKHKGKTKGAGR